MELNKEEQEAIEFLDGLKDFKVTIYSSFWSRGEFKFSEKEVKYFDIILNLIEKRNKRIHSLEKDIQFIIDKIINKIKIYQYHTKITAGTHIDVNIAQTVLQELLEEISKEI